MAETESPHIVAVGAGRMGRGIAHMFAYAGLPVTLLDIKSRNAADFAALASQAREEITGNMIFLASLGIMTESQVKQALALINVCPASEAATVLGWADFVLEGVPETKEAKAQVLGLIGELAPMHAIVASTTSTFLVTEMQQLIPAPARFLNTHFLNPAYLIPLVEVSAGPTTDEDVVQRTLALFTRIGKVPVRCRAAPGYIIPRLQALLMSEACRMVAEGVATPEEIDKAITHGFGPRYATMGVLEFIDWGGVDILYYAGNYLAKALDSPRHAPPPEVEQMMLDGRKGMREGQGYYDFRNMDVARYQQEKLSRFVALLKSLGQMPAPGVPDQP